MLEDESVIVAESDASAKAISVESEIGSAVTLSPQSRKGPEILGCSDALTARGPPIEPLNQPASAERALPHRPCGEFVREDDHGVTAAASPFTSTPPPPPWQSKARTPALEEDEWEIRKIVCKRRVGKEYEYRVRWRDTWLPRSELGKAQRLVRQFKGRGCVQQRLQKKRAKSSC